MLSSAQQILPHVLRYVSPNSVIDVGCGVGTWLSVFFELGITDVTGVDGDYIERSMLEIPEEKFLAHNLETPLRLSRQFDLVVSLEVAEHLPQTVAEDFVDSLVALGPVILFSAAIPYQAGENHVNEQWPSYWASMFHERGYQVADCIRKHVWENPDVAWWYAQNTLLFANEEALDRLPLLRTECERTSRAALSIVHPSRYLRLCEHGI